MITRSIEGCKFAHDSLHRPLRRGSHESLFFLEIGEGSRTSRSQVSAWCQYFILHITYVLLYSRLFPRRAQLLLLERLAHVWKARHTGQLTFWVLVTTKTSLMSFFPFFSVHRGHEPRCTSCLFNCTSILSSFLSFFIIAGHLKDSVHIYISNLNFIVNCHTSIRILSYLPLPNSMFSLKYRHAMLFRAVVGYR